MSTQLSLAQAAKLLKVSEKSVRRYIKAGRMRATLIKGQKGYEYRIDKSQLKEFVKPPRGKNSHKKIRVKSSPQKPTLRKGTKTPKKPKSTNIDFMSSVKEIAQKRMIEIAGDEEEKINYRILYERLLTKYEQSLMMIGNLEAQLANSPTNEFINKTSRTIPADQEETILELYQLLRQNQKHQEL